MKRSSQIRLLLLGSALTTTSAIFADVANTPVFSAGNVYPNNAKREGVGYFHAPYRDWFPYRYNEYDTTKKLYYHGGQWTAEPHTSIVNLAEPLVERPSPAQPLANNSIHHSGSGYYHQAYGRWFPHRYNEYNSATGNYYHGGNWTPKPHVTPPPVQRNGFGSTSGLHSIHS